MGQFIEPYFVDLDVPCGLRGETIVEDGAGFLTDGAPVSIKTPAATKPAAPAAKP